MLLIPVLLKASPYLAETPGCEILFIPIHGHPGPIHTQSLGSLDTEDLEFEFGPRRRNGTPILHQNHLILAPTLRPWIQPASVLTGLPHCPGPDSFEDIAQPSSECPAQL